MRGFPAIAGINPREDLVRLSARLTTSRPMWRMMARLGAHPDGSWWYGSEDMLVRAIDRCAACEHTGSCASWFERGAPEPTPPSFCPNSRMMAACQIMATAQAGREAATDEPGLHDVLDEPIVQALMAADRVSEQSLRSAWSARQRNGKVAQASNASARS
jgi:hypothetical protein